MKIKPIKVLAIEDSAADLLILQETLQGIQPLEFSVTGAQRLDEGLEKLRRENFAVLLLDLGLPDSQGIDTLQKVREQFSEIPIVVMTGFDDEATGLEAIQSGAQDYIVKGQMPALFQSRAIRYAIERKKSEQALHAAKEDLAKANQELETRVKDRTAELQQSNAELESLSYSISHDLRAPLRAMQGFSEALLHDYEDKLDEQGRDFLKRICKASQRLDLLIQDVLTYSWPSTTQLQLVPVDLAALISETIESSPALQPPEALITVTEPLPPVLGHPAFLAQIISNLLVNAVKFTAPDVAPHVFISAEFDQGMVRVSVRDNGIGIDPSHFDLIFQIFGRVHSDQLYQGTGIGLAIVKKAVERMGGQVGVESAVGEGSRFWFTLKGPVMSTAVPEKGFTAV
jgi:signal transduction histidine kinase